MARHVVSIDHCLESLGDGTAAAVAGEEVGRVGDDGKEP